MFLFAFLFLLIHSFFGLLANANNQSQPIVTANGVTRTCIFSHSAVGGANVFVCKGDPVWIISGADTEGDGNIEWVLLSPESNWKIPQQLTIELIYQNGKMIFARRNINQNYREEPLDLSKIQNEYLKLNHAYDLIRLPYQKKFSKKEKKMLGKYFFYPIKKGDVPHPLADQTIAKFLLQAENRLVDFAKKLNPNHLSVELEGGTLIQCKRDESKNIEKSCDLFICDSMNKNGKSTQTVLQYFSDPARGISNGIGLGGPLVFSIGEGNKVSSMKVKRIFSASENFYQKRKVKNPWDLFKLPAESLKIIKDSGVGSIIPEIQNASYYSMLQNLSGECKSTDHVLENIRKHHYQVRSILDQQKAVLLYELSAKSLRARTISPDKLGSNICYLGGDTYYRPEVRSKIPKELFTVNQLTPIDEEKMKKIFKEVESMKDIPYQFLNSGCEARAHIIADRLKKMGYPVQKIWAQGGNLSPYKFKNGKWTFHVAVALPVVSKNGSVEWQVIDTALANQAISTKDWLRRIQPTAGGNAIWTKWPQPLESQGFSKTIAWLSPPEIYEPHEIIFPNKEQQKNNFIRAEKTIQNMHNILHFIKTSPKEAEKEGYIQEELLFRRDEV